MTLRASAPQGEPSPFAEIGPVTPSAAAVYARARKVRELAQIAAEVAMPGARQDVARAVKLLAMASAILGAAPDGARGDAA